MFDKEHPPPGANVPRSPGRRDTLSLSPLSRRSHIPSDIDRSIIVTKSQAASSSFCFRWQAALPQNHRPSPLFGLRTPFGMHP